MIKRDLILRIAAILLAAAVLYVLSVGPADALLSRLDKTHPVPADRLAAFVGKFYWPLVYLMEGDSALGAVLKEYDRWWWTNFGNHR